jgi:DnaJ domain/PilZ domain
MIAAQERRRHPRMPRANLASLRLQFVLPNGQPRTEPAQLEDLNPQGCRLNLNADLAANTPVLIVGDVTSGGAEMQVRGRVAWSQQLSKWHWMLGVEFAANIQIGSQAQAAAQPAAAADDDSADYYETLQLSPNADAETIQRVYRILAARYHPDNLETGDANAFKRVHQAHLTLADPQRRAAYDASHLARTKLRWKIFDQPAAAQGKRAERAKRQGVLSLLYTKRIASPGEPGVSTLELEDMLGVPREHLEFSLWFLKESGFVGRTDGGKLSITLKGVLEAEQQDQEREAELREDHLIEAPV